MRKAESTLTDRYQTTIPEMVRESLHLHKRDKIAYILEEDGKVVISRLEDDPILQQFLVFLANDIKNNPSNVRVMSLELFERAQSLVSDIDIDLNAQLDDKDE